MAYPAPPTMADAPPSLPSSPGVLVLRVLIASAFVAGWVQAIAEPTRRSIGAALSALSNGRLATDALSVPDVVTNVSGLAGLAALIFLIAGPQPRWATKWAWFWLTCAMTPLWVVFLVIEPVPLWVKEPQPQRSSRLTGGWAFLLSLVAPAILGSLAAFGLVTWTPWSPWW